MASSSTTKPVLLIGSTGNVGFATVNALSTKGISTRAGVRDPTSDKAKQLATLACVELVHADLGTPASLPAAMAGVDVVYLITPGHADRSALVGAGVDAAKAAGVSHIVVVSVPSVVAADALIFKGQFEEIEAKVTGAGLRYTLLRVPMFFENQWASQGTIKQGQLYGPANPAKSFTLIAVGDLAEAGANVLATPVDHVDKTYTVGSDTLTMNDITTAFAAAAGHKVAYVQVPYTAAVESMVGMGFPDWMAKGVAELLKLGDAASPAAVFKHTDLTMLLGHSPTSFTTWADGVADAFKA